MLEYDLDIDFSFTIIAYRKARMYIAFNMNKTDQRLSPL